MYYIIDKYNTNLTLDKYNDLIEKYNLKYVDQCKKYTIQNIEIISNLNSIQFYKLKNKQNIDNFEVYEIYKSIPFSFFDSDTEEIYQLYMNSIHNVDILMKKYKNFIKIEYLTEDLKNLELIDK